MAGLPIEVVATVDHPVDATEIGHLLESVESFSHLPASRRSPAVGGTCAQLVELLPAAEYDHEHLRGAINIPLEALGTETVSVLDRTRPVIGY